MPFASHRMSESGLQASEGQAGAGEGDRVATHVVGVVILIVGQLDHAVGALSKGRGPRKLRAAP